jgi:hypothetical protein
MVTVSDGKVRPQPMRLHLSMELLRLQKEELSPINHNYNRKPSPADLRVSTYFRYDTCVIIIIIIIMYAISPITFLTISVFCSICGGCGDGIRFPGFWTKCWRFSFRYWYLLFSAIPYYTFITFMIRQSISRDRSGEHSFIASIFVACSFFNSHILVWLHSRDSVCLFNSLLVDFEFNLVLRTPLRA